MTKVRELIEQLKCFPPEDPVLAYFGTSVDELERLGFKPAEAVPVLTVFEGQTPMGRATLLLAAPLRPVAI
jgi:hypothetical protein